MEETKHRRNEKEANSCDRHLAVNATWKKMETLQSQGISMASLNLQSYLAKLSMDLSPGDSLLQFGLRCPCLPHFD